MSAQALSFAFALLLFTAAPGTGFAGSLLGNSDGDQLDDIVDNCRDVANPDQTDTDLDGCGNACDCDYDNNGKCGGSDFAKVRHCFGLSATAVVFSGFPCALVDSNNDGKIGGADFNTLRRGFNHTAGPSLSPLRKPAICRAF
jgi:hypothetical protein